MSHSPPSPATASAGAASMSLSPSAPDAAPALDARTLDQLTQLDPTGANRLMARVLTAYTDSLARLRAQIAAARASGDLAATRLAVHTLKSSSASIGALQLAALCAGAEQAAREGQVDTLNQLLETLGSEASRVDAAVQQLLSQHG